MNLKIKFNSNKDDILVLFLKIAGSVKNPAFFNWTESTIKDDLKTSKTVSLYDEDLNRHLAFISFRETDEVIDIMALGVHPEFVGQGLMKQLLTHLQSNSREASKAIVLEVHQENQPAIELYNRMGFRKINFRPSYYQDGLGAFIYKWG